MVEGRDERAAFHVGADERLLTALAAVNEEDGAEHDVAEAEDANDGDERDGDGLRRRVGRRGVRRVRDGAEDAAAVVRRRGGGLGGPCGSGGERVRRDTGNLLGGGLDADVDTAALDALCGPERDVVGNLRTYGRQLVSVDMCRGISHAFSARPATSSTPISPKDAATMLGGKPKTKVDMIRYRAVRRPQ